MKTFNRNTTIKKVLRLGRFTEIDFKSRNEIADWIFNNITLVLGIKKIPNDIMFELDHQIGMPWKYWNTINIYCETYLTVNNQTNGFSNGLMRDVKDKLAKKGYPKIAPKEGKDTDFLNLHQWDTEKMYKTEKDFKNVRMQ